MFGQLKGIVLDAVSRAPLPFANVVTNTGKTTFSGYSGDFIILDLSAADTLVKVSYVGYQSTELRIDSVGLLLVKLIPETIPINEITVASGFLGNHLKSITGHINILLEEEFDLRQLENVASYLNTLPGVFMASGSSNTNKLSIRGIGSRTLYGTNRIKMYLNDIPITSADGITSPEDIDVNRLVKMEVLKGPSSALYGSGLGGSVHMQTNNASNVSGYSYGMQYGSYGFMSMTPALTYATDALQLNTSFTYTHANGYRQNSKYIRKSGIVTGSYTKNRHFLSCTFLVSDLYSGIPSSVDYETFMNSPRNAATNWLNTKGYEKYTKLTAGIAYKRLFAGLFKIKSVMFTNYTDGYERRPFNTLDDEMVNGGIRGYIEYSNNTFASILGTEYMLESYHWNIYETITDSQEALTAKYSERRHSADFFQLNTFKPNDRLSFEMGINLNLLKYKLMDQFNADSTNRSGQYTYSPDVSPKMGVNYAFSSNYNLYFSVSKGFSPPTVEETLLPEGTINDGLKPETGWNIELGARGQLLDKSLFFDFSVYRIMLRNLLVNKRVAEDVFTGLNAGKTNHFGLEVNLNYKLRQGNKSDRFQLDAITSFWTSINQFMVFNDDGIDYAQKYLPGIPAYSLYAKLKMQFKFHAGIVLEYRSVGRQYLNDANTGTYGDYGLVSLNLSYKREFKKEHSALVFFGIENLLNCRYASMILVNAPSFGANQPRYYYPGNPIQFQIGLRITNISGK
jgi:iron complex outermembrane recepter protein